MKARFILFRRGQMFYCEDTTTKKQASLKTKDKAEALTLLNARNEAARQPQLNVQIARTYLSASDPAITQRTWQAVMDQMQTHGKPETQTRCARAMRSTTFDPLRIKAIVETNAEDILNVLKDCNVSEAHYLRRLHNLALGLGWLAVPALAPRLRPKPQYQVKRGITLDEHKRILAEEKNAERNLYYQLLWEIGASQSDAAALTAENIDWPSRTLTYFRKKTGEQAQMTISKRLEEILSHLQTEGPLFTNLHKAGSNTRAANFRGLCKRLKIEGVSLHSYRYAWAERAKSCGFPERFAQAALGHNSQAVHRAYAKKAKVLIPSLEEYEKKQAA
jgi:integrase